MENMPQRPQNEGVDDDFRRIMQQRRLRLEIKGEMRKVQSEWDFSDVIDRGWPELRSGTDG